MCSCFFHIVSRVITAISSHCLAALTAKMSAFNRHIQQNAYYRKFSGAFEDLLPIYCYAIKANSKPILSQPPLQEKERTGVNCKLITA